MRRGTRSLVTAGIAVLTAASLALPALAASTPRASLRNSVESWATPSHRLGKAASNRAITFHVVLGWRNQAGLKALMASVSDPRSAAYRHFLTPAQFEARFSPSSAEVDAVTSWLRGQGLGVLSVPQDRLFVQARGTVAQIERAFHTSISMYKTSDGTRYGASAAPSVPDSLRAIVTGIDGLSQVQAHPNMIFASGSPNDLPPPPALFRNAPPCSTYFGQKIDQTDPPAYGQQQPYVQCGLLPNRVRNAYAAGAGSLDGTGVTVAIIDAFGSPSIVKDASKWSTKRNLPIPNITQTVFPPDITVDSGWWAEESLDVEAVHGMAPGAAIQYVGGADNNNTGLDFAQNYVVENALATIVSNSYGYLGEVSSSIRQTEDAIYSMGVATGVGFFFSSGDEGDDSLIFGQATPNWPASSTNVTAVGGTSLATTSGAGYSFETYWGTDKSTLTGGVWTPNPPGDWLYGAGAGTSHVINEPAYQVGVVPDQFSSLWGGEHRVVPDISLDGDPNTGFEIGFTQAFATGQNKYSEYRIGGTSLSCPLLAGLMALIDQNAGTTLGFINPALYQLYQDNPAAFRDVQSPASTVAVVRVDYANGYNGDLGTTTSLRTMNDLLTLSSIVGWDNSTGPGSPNGMAFINGLASP